MKKTITACGLFLFLHSLPCGAQNDTISLPNHDGTKIREIKLDEVTVQGSMNDKKTLMRSSQNLVSVHRDYLNANFSGSLMQTLENIPGIKAMSIGSGQSKPTIRGLGFNRMVITENGIKHEGQQWGHDHGLEIDQFSVDRIEVIKGPAAILYGSDAIGGAINLYNNYIPLKFFEGRARLFYRSNNESYGMAVQIAGRNKRFYYKANMTLVDYADYQVPADSIQYYSYFIKLKDSRLRNTAGKERDGSIILGYEGLKLRSYFRISDIYSKSGFFANAHGLEVRLSNIDYDHSLRDINLPYQSVNHFKIENHTSYTLGHVFIKGDFAYQNNHRKETAEPVSHGYMPTPPNEIEREFDKHTYSANIGIQTSIADKHDLRAGTNFEFQRNRRQGWGFVIPDFENRSIGAYAIEHYQVNDDLMLSAGIRYDRVNVKTNPYTDWYKTPVSETDSVYKQRSAEMDRVFSNLSWSLGMTYSTGNWVWKANLGKSFRAPIPKELGADGINYHIFRYERGNAGLNTEESYQVDLGINWSNRQLNIQLSPYFNYFPNYIYLNPTSDYQEGLQVYDYTQSKVMRLGAELEAHYHFSPRWEAELAAEYLYAEQLSGEKKGFTLPFSTPWSANVGLKYLISTKADNECYIATNYKVVGDQNEIVPPEKTTKGHQIVNMSAGKSFSFNGCKLDLSLQAQNIFNKKYFDHTSYYRLIDVPEPGRNFLLMVNFEY